MSTPETPAELARRIAEHIIADFSPPSVDSQMSDLDIPWLVECMQPLQDRAEQAEAALAKQSAQLATLQKEVEAHKEAAQRAVAHYKEGMDACRKEGIHAALQFSRAADAANSILLYASRQAAADEKESAK